MQGKGHMIEYVWDGQTLKVHGTNTMSRVALAGEDHGGGDVILDREEIAKAIYHPPKGPLGMTNGELRIETTAGKVYKLHFRKKQAKEFSDLADELQTIIGLR